MAFEKPILTDSLLSSGGSSGNQYRAVFATSSASAGGYAVVATRGSKWTGILQENSTEAKSMLVMYGGISRVAAGDSSGGAVINENTVLIASSKGQAVAATSAGSQFMLGYALSPLAASSTGVIAVLLTPGALTT